MAKRIEGLQDENLSYPAPERDYRKTHAHLGEHVMKLREPVIRFVEDDLPTSQSDTKTPQIK